MNKDCLCVRICHKNVSSYSDTEIPHRHTHICQRWMGGAVDCGFFALTQNLSVAAKCQVHPPGHLHSFHCQHIIDLFPILRIYILAYIMRAKTVHWHVTLYWQAWNKCRITIQWKQRKDYQQLPRQMSVFRIAQTDVYSQVQ